MNALAFLESRVGIAVDRTHLAPVVSRISTRTSYGSDLDSLERDGLIVYAGQSRCVVLTRAGWSAARTVADPPARWRLLEVLAGVYPGSLLRTSAAKQAGESGRAFLNSLYTLHRAGLITFIGHRHIVIAFRGDNSGDQPPAPIRFLKPRSLTAPGDPGRLLQQRAE